MRYRFAEPKKSSRRRFAYLPKRLFNGTWIWLEEYERYHPLWERPNSGNSRTSRSRNIQALPSNADGEFDARQWAFGDEFELEYHPSVDVATERIAGFRVIPRLRDPPGDPRASLPDAADWLAGLGEWTIRSACKQFDVWSTGVRLSVDVSPFGIDTRELEKLVLPAVADGGIPPASLELILDERILARAGEDELAALRDLRQSGLRLALDCSASPLPQVQALGRLPFDNLKLQPDLGATADLDGDFQATWLAKCVEMAEAVGSAVTAREVGNVEVLALVRDAGFTLAQGSLYSEPVRVGDAVRLLACNDGHLPVGAQESRREPRSVSCRKIGVHHDGYCYEGSVRNLSPHGALIDGLWDVPAATRFLLEFDGTEKAWATCRWSRGRRMGVEFDSRLNLRQIAATADYVPQTGWRDLPTARCVA